MSNKKVRKMKLLNVSLDFERMLKECIKGVSRVSPRCCKGVWKVFQRCVQGVSMVFQMCFKVVLKVYQLYYSNISIELSGCFGHVSKVFQGFQWYLWNSEISYLHNHGTVFYNICNYFHNFRSYSAFWNFL